jgi:transposase
MSIKRWILSLNKVNEEFNEKDVESGRLIIGYSEKRARMDAYNREKGIRRLKKSFKKGTITKDNLNKRGYNKFLEPSNDVHVAISEDKIKEDEKWDGLKGYITNTELTAAQVHEQYSGLWQVEKAFRVTKGTVEMRPMFHFTSRRIEAHVCIGFVAYKIYKELERVLKLKGILLSVDEVLNIAKTVTTITVRLPATQKRMTQTMIVTEKQKQIAPLFDENFWNFRDF